MTDRDPDLDGDDQALARMTHSELVALLNRLYARLGEKRVSTSTALASTDDELRDTIGAARQRLAIRLGRAPVLPFAPSTRRRAAREDFDAEDPAASPVRAFVVLFASDNTLVSSARAACRGRGIPLVAVSSTDLLAALIASVTPTHIVVVGEGFAAEDVAASTILARDLEHRGVHVRVCPGAEEAMQVLAEIGL